MLSALIAFLLTKHLLAPVRQLIAGTKELASLKFETRIDVRSGDELGNLGEAFNTMAQTIQRYEQMRKQWVSDISHELRTPLSILRGEIEALQDGVREVNIDNLKSLHSEVMHIGKIVQDLYELSLADSDVLHFTMEPVNAALIAYEVVHRFGVQLKDEKITLNNKINAANQVLVKGDLKRLIQLFSNIVQNTVHYADKPGTLTVWDSVVDDAWEINFQDSGPGVPEEAINLIFDRLYRVDPSRSREHHSSGLGLSICKYITKRHNGEITAVNQPRPD